jgi:hypothetical protein
MKLSITLAATAIALMFAPLSAEGQARMIRVAGGAAAPAAAGGYPAEPLVVLPYASGSGQYGAGQQQPQVPQPLPPNVVEQQEDMQEQQAPSMILTDPDDSALSQPPMDDPQDGSGFDGLQSIENVDSSY